MVSRKALPTTFLAPTLAADIKVAAKYTPSYFGNPYPKPEFQTCFNTKMYTELPVLD
jgi:hypothetical protein